MLISSFALQAIVCSVFIVFGIIMTIEEEDYAKIFGFVLTSISLIWLINLIHHFISLG